MFTLIWRHSSYKKVMIPEIFKMEQLLKLFSKHQLLNQPAEKYTLLVDEGQITNGALFFLAVNGKTYKVIIKAPYHEALLAKGIPTIKDLLEHREAMYLK